MHRKRQNSLRIGSTEPLESRILLCGAAMEMSVVAGAESEAESPDDQPATDSEASSEEATGGNQASEKANASDDQSSAAPDDSSREELAGDEAQANDGSVTDQADGDAQSETGTDADLVAENNASEQQETEMSLAGQDDSADVCPVAQVDSNGEEAEAASEDAVAEPEGSESVASTEVDETEGEATSGDEEVVDTSSAEADELVASAETEPVEPDCVEESSEASGDAIVQQDNVSTSDDGNNKFHVNDETRLSSSSREKQDTSKSAWNRRLKGEHQAKRMEWVSEKQSKA